MALVRSEPGRIWRLTLDRPEARNAVSAAMMAELTARLGDAAADPEARVVVLSGRGRDFCAGTDLDDLVSPPSEAEALELVRPLEAAIRAIGEHPLPVLAEVHGAALGAGCQIVVACDLAIAARDATIGIPSARLGVVIGYENVERLVRAVGPKRAGDILLSARAVTGDEAAAWGLVNQAVDPEALSRRVDEVAGEIAALAPLSVRASKRGIRAAQAKVSLERETEAYRVADFDMMAAAALASEDLREGIRAFRERRRPEFRGK